MGDIIFVNVCLLCVKSVFEYRMLNDENVMRRDFTFQSNLLVSCSLFYVVHNQSGHGVTHSQGTPWVLLKLLHSAYWTVTSSVPLWYQLSNLHFLCCSFHSGYKLYTWQWSKYTISLLHGSLIFVHFGVTRGVPLVEFSCVYYIVVEPQCSIVQSVLLRGHLLV